MEERPMTRDELRAKTLKSLGKREGQAKAYAGRGFRKPDAGRASAMKKLPPAIAEDT
jgi:hypothetical protein